MSAWNAILQATHSSLIDELNARFPDEILELGLPKRLEGFSLLDPAAKSVLWEVRCIEGTGIAGLARTPAQPESELESIFAGTRIRAEKEFKIRRISAEFLRPVNSPARVQMTIWIPILIRRKDEIVTFDLAIGA